MLYFAYGSNLNVEQMKRRCPGAKKLGALYLQDARLVFRGVADIEFYKGSEVAGGVWEVTEKCEEMLDRYEGVRSGLYRKEYIKVSLKRKGVRVTEQMLVYRMNSEYYAEPPVPYLCGIREGYDDFGLKPKHLYAAVELTAKLYAKQSPQAREQADEELLSREARRLERKRENRKNRKVKAQDLTGDGEARAA